jgi:hypothetical protein
LALVALAVFQPQEKMELLALTLYLVRLQLRLAVVLVVTAVE